MTSYNARPIAFSGGDGYLQAPELVQEGIEKEWSYAQRCFVYRISSLFYKESKKRKENLESIISHYYKLR